MGIGRAVNAAIDSARAENRGSALRSRQVLYAGETLEACHPTAASCGCGRQRFHTGARSVASGAGQRSLDVLLLQQREKLSRRIQLRQSRWHIRFLGELGDLSKYRQILVGDLKGWGDD